MKKADLIKEIVPATIKCWKDGSPKYKHDGKEKQLTKIYSEWTKKDLVNRLENLKAKGYA